MKRVLMLASVATMIKEFNMENINILKELGYQIDVACNFDEGNSCDSQYISQFKKELEDLNIRYYQIDFARSVSKITQHIRAYKQIKKIMTDGSYFFIHCHSPIGGALARLAGYKTGTKIIYTAHGFHFYKHGPVKNWFLYYPVEKLLAYCTDVLITINKEDFSLAKRKLKAKRIRYIPGVGISVNEIEKIIADRGQVRTELGIDENAFVLISAGELNKNKNHQVVIQALRELKGRNIQYLICGQGPQKEELMLSARRAGLERQIHFLGYRKDVIRLCKASDCFMFPSKREGLGLAALEGMACGLPLISSNSGGIKDYAADGKTGFCINYDDVTGFKQSISKLMENPELCRMVGEYNKHAVQKFDIRHTEKIMRQIYKDI